MFENLAALDIGTYSIKLVSVRTGFRDFQLKSFAYEDIDLEIEDGYEAIRDAVTRILEEEKLTGCKVITNLPMEKEIIRNISFPFSDVEKIAEAIPYEAEENIPFKLDDLILDFQSLKHGRENEGRILLAAAHKDTLYDFLGVLNDCGIKPIKMGMEANALFECYRYFNKIDDESVIQIDIGHNKTIVNFISENRLLYTRSISIGLSLIHRAIADILRISSTEAAKTFENLNIDLTSFENNVQRNYYKNLEITKQKFKKIFTAADEIFEDLVEQIILTLKALQVDCGDIAFSRILISGGGSNLSGIGSVLSRELDLPVIDLPFLEDYEEKRIQTQFPIAFGTILTYINHKRSSINFLKGEFIPDIAQDSMKIYYLSGTFAAFTLVLLIINFIISAVLTSRSNSEYNTIINKRFNTYFNSSIKNDPITDAMKKLNKEKKNLEGLTQFIPEDSSVLDLLNDILSHFPQGVNLDLKNLVINERVIRIDGSISESKKIDEFKDKLSQSKKYESVQLNIRYSRQNTTRFSLTIKLKLPKNPDRRSQSGR